MFHKGIDDVGNLVGAFCDYFFVTFIMTKVGIFQKNKNRKNYDYYYQESECTDLTALSFLFSTRILQDLSYFFQHVL